MKDRLRIAWGIGVLLIVILACAAVVIPWGAANLTTCRTVEAAQLANEGYPN